jgi:hypothetical protein
MSNDTLATQAQRRAHSLTKVNDANEAVTPLQHLVLGFMDDTPCHVNVSAADITSMHSIAKELCVTFLQLLDYSAFDDTDAVAKVSMTGYGVVLPDHPENVSGVGHGNKGGITDINETVL